MTSQPSTSTNYETNAVQNNKKVGTKTKQDTKTSVEIKKKKQDTKPNVENKKNKQVTKTNVEIKKTKKVIIKTETPPKGEIDIEENPLVPYRSTRTYSKNKSCAPHITAKEDIKPDKEIKTEVEITENEFQPDTVIKIENDLPADSDQMQIFANTVALQLNNLPFDVAMNLQVKIQKLIVEESVKFINSISNGKQ